MSKILCIIRTSTLQQELDSQRSEMETFCHGIGYRDIVWIEAKGASARSANGEYLSMLEKVKASILNDPSIDAVGVWHLNRLGRREKYIVGMKSWFIEHKINVYIKNPSLTLFNSDGTLNQGISMVINLLAVSIEIDTEELMAKTKRGKDHNRESGRFNGGAFGTLFGYKVDPNGYIQPDPDEKYIIKGIFEAYATGRYSYSSLASEYRDRGIQHRGRRINDTFIKKVLHEERYAKGTSRFEPIIDVSLYEKVRSVAGSNLISQPKGARMLMGVKVVRCRQCGSNYTADRDKYICYRRAKADRFDSACDSPSVSIEVMDRVLLYVARILHGIYLSTPDTDAIDMEKARLEAVLQKVEASKSEHRHLGESLDRLRELFIDGQIDRERYNSKESGLKARQAALNEAREAYLKEAEAIRGRIHTLENPDFTKFNDIFTDLCLEDNRKRLKEIVDQHIRAAYVSRGVHDGRKCMEIEVEPYDGHAFRFIYFHTKSKEDVYRVMADGFMKV